MLTSIILSIVLIIFGIFFVIYKRKMLVSSFLLQADHPEVKLQEELQKTGDDIIAGLEERIVHLEKLLAAADERIALLSQQTAKKDLNPQQEIVLPPQQMKHIDIIDKPDTDDFAKQLILATDNMEKQTIDFAEKKTVSDYPVKSTIDRKAGSEKPAEAEQLSAEAVAALIAEAKSDSTQRRRQAVLQLVNHEFSPRDVAQQTGLGIGEIMLLLKLGKK